MAKRLIPIVMGLLVISMTVAAQSAGSPEWLYVPSFMAHSTAAEREQWKKEYDALIAKLTGLMALQAQKAYEWGGSATMTYIRDKQALIAQREKAENEPARIAAWQAAAAKAPFAWTMQKAVLPAINVSADKLSMAYSPDLTKIVIIGPDTVIEEKHGGISPWVSQEIILGDRYYSANGGKTWATVKPAPSNDEYNSLHGLSDTYLCYANGVFLSRSSFQNRSSPPRYVSSLSNGKMSQVELPLSVGMIGKIVSNGDRFFVIGTYADPKNPYAMMYMAWSSDGVNWTRVPMSAIGAKNAETVSVMGVITTAPGSDLSTYFTDIFYGAGRFWGQRTDGKLLFSSDAVTWTAGGTPPIEIKKIIGGDGKYVGTDHWGSGKIAYSSDGINWREVNIPVSISSLAYGGGWFLGTGGGAWFSSGDGINWNIVPGGLDSLHGMEAKNFVYDGSKFIANFYTTHYDDHGGKGYVFDDTWAYSVRK